MEKENTERDSKDVQYRKRSPIVCKACGQKFSFGQRFLVSSHSTLTCKKCHAQYKVQMNMNAGRVSAMGGGLGGACIIAGYLLGDRFFLRPFAGLTLGILLAACITIIIYRYTWRKIELYPA